MLFGQDGLEKENCFLVPMKMTVGYEMLLNGVSVHQQTTLLEECLLGEDG